MFGTRISVTLGGIFVKADWGTFQAMFEENLERMDFGESVEEINI